MKRRKLLNKKEEKIIKEQIVKNGTIITGLIKRIELLVNREGHKQDSVVVCDLRKRLVLVMEENDTFRRVYWRHVQCADESFVDSEYEAVRYLMIRIKQRGSASHALSCEYEIGVGN